MFGSLLRDMERDPIFGAHSRAMNRMMDSFFGDFGGFGVPNRQAIAGPMGMDALMPFGGMMNQFSPFAMMNPMNPMGGMENMMANGMNNDRAAFSSMSFMSVTNNGGSGQPHVYQASSQTRQAGGLKETRKTVQDSRSGVKKMAVGRHIGDRGHVVEREENLYTGQRNEQEDLVNLDYEQKPQFLNEWKSRAYGGGYTQDHRQLTDSASSSRPVPRYNPGRSATYTSGSGGGVTIEEVDSDNEDTQPKALPAIPCASSSTATATSSSPTRRHRDNRERRHKEKPSYSKRPRKMY